MQRPWWSPSSPRGDGVVRPSLPERAASPNPTCQGERRYPGTGPAVIRVQPGRRRTWPLSRRTRRIAARNRQQHQMPTYSCHRRGNITRTPSTSPGSTQLRPGRQIKAGTLTGWAPGIARRLAGQEGRAEPPGCSPRMQSRCTCSMSRWSTRFRQPDPRTGEPHRGRHHHCVASADRHRGMSVGVQPFQHRP